MLVTDDAEKVTDSERPLVRPETVVCGLRSP
jgi:hypothetical protein